MGADVAADKHKHDVVPQGQLSFIEPDPDVINAGQLIGSGDGGVHPGLIVGEQHPGDRGGRLIPLAHHGPGTLPHHAVMT